MTHSGYPAMQAVVRSTSHNHTQVLDRRDHSGLMLAARITLAHFLLRGCHPALGKRVVGDGGGRPDGRSSLSPLHSKNGFMMLVREES
jgi:hypothetical protein